MTSFINCWRWRFPNIDLFHATGLFRLKQLLSTFVNFWVDLPFLDFWIKGVLDRYNNIHDKREYTSKFMEILFYQCV